MNYYTYAKMLKKATEGKTEPTNTNTNTTNATPTEPSFWNKAKAWSGENWDKAKAWSSQQRPWLLPTAAGVAGTGLGYAMLGAIPGLRRNRVLRNLLALGIGGATAGGTYYFDNVYGKKDPKAQA